MGNYGKTGKGCGGRGSGGKLSVTSEERERRARHIEKSGESIK